MTAIIGLIGIKGIIIVLATIGGGLFFWRWKAKRDVRIRLEAQREVVDKVNATTREAEEVMRREVAKPTTKKQTRKRLDEGNF